MGFSDEAVERRGAWWSCDQCGVFEVRYYDAVVGHGADRYSSEGWEHDWQLVPSPQMAVRMGDRSRAFCSQACLVVYHDNIVKRAYGGDHGGEALKLA